MTGSKIPLLALSGLFFRTIAFSQVVPGFTAPSAVCLGTPVNVTNTTTGATSYFWSFCAADFSSAPQATNLGNPSGALNSPVFGAYAQDNSGNFFGIVTNYAIGHVSRLSFGSSLLNAPTGVDMGDFGGIIPEQLEGIQLEQVNGNWTALIVGGGNQSNNSAPRIVKLDFGTSLANTPVATNWGNIGGLNLPHDFIVLAENGNYYGLTENVNDNTLTRLSFGPDFTNPPTGVNLGNIGGLSYPCGLTYIRYNGNIYVYVVDRLTDNITRLDFGSSILNTPTATSLGNPGGYLSYPRDISLFTTCSGIYGFVSNEMSNELVQLNFGNDPLAIPTATDLGNVGNLSFPHSISDFFRVGNDIYAFIHNVVSNSLTLLHFVGCQNIPGSSAQNPPAVNYTEPGLYTINLLVDLGLPTQTSFCREVTVNPLPAGRLTGDTVCFGNAAALLFSGEAGTAPYTIGYSDGQNNYTANNLGAQSPVPPPYPLNNAGPVSFELQTVTDANACQSTIDSATTVLVRPLPQGGISGTAACATDSVRLFFQGQGAGPFAVILNENGNVFNESGVPDGSYIELPPLPTNATYTLISMTDTAGCVRTSGFTAPTAALTVYASPQLQFDSLAAVCIDKAPFALGAGSETSGLTGTGVYSGPGINAAGEFSPFAAGPGEHLITYTYSTSTCVDSIRGGILVHGLPPARPAATASVCGIVPVQLTASGGITYSWSPPEGLNDPTLPNPVATADTSITYIATVTDSNGCVAFDSVTLKVAIGGKNYFQAPNAFTPNGDGHNDCWGIQYWPGVTVQQLQVYNRWGEIVFSTNNPGDCWDGTAFGQAQPAGAYAYVIRALTPCGVVVRKGTLILVR